MQYKKLVYFYIILLTFLVLSLNVCLIRAEFNKDNPETWKEDLKKFEGLSDKEKNDGWIKLSYDKKISFLIEYAKSKKKTIVFSGDFGSSELKWEGKILTNGKASIDFNNLLENIIEINYNSNNKIFTYKIKTNSGEIKFSFDEGSVNEKGVHVIKGRKYNVELISEKGFVEYKNGKYIISNGATIRIATENGAAVFMENKETSDVSGPAELQIKSDGSFLHKKAMVTIFEVETTATGAFGVGALTGNYNIKVKDKSLCDFLSGNEEIALFLGKKPDKFEDAYQYVNLAKKEIENNGKDSYSVVRILGNFASVQGKGNRAYVVNGNALISFLNGKVHMEINGKGLFNVDKIGLIGETFDPKKGWYIWRKNTISKTADFFHTGERFIQKIAESKAGWTGPGKYDVSTSSVGLLYSKEFTKEYFRPSKEGLKPEEIERERLLAIMNDQKTVLKMNFPPNHPIPGQMVAAEMLSKLELGQIIFKIKQEKEGLGGLATDAYNDPMTRASASFGLIIQNSMKTDYKVSPGMSPEDISKMPEINRFLYTLATTYSGDVSDMMKNEKGVTSLEYRSDGIYVNGQKVPSVSATTANALRNMMTQQLSYYVPGQGIRSPDIIKYQAEIDKAYRFGTEYRSDPFKDRLYGPEPTGRSFFFRFVPGSRIDAAKQGMQAAKDAPYKYTAYKKVGVLP